MSVDSLSIIRDRLLPMMEVTADRYRGRVPRGYPHMIDTPQQGVVGLEIDASHALYVTSDGADLFAEIYRRAPRTDNRSGAGREKFSGLPFNDRRPIGADVSDQDLRNLLADLMSYFNSQPNLIHITDD
ncbi:MAG: hypothetical protein H0T93_13080 [Chloroflexia bacterium]|nr:hypothetical protein [Chloroflexia bacterium]